MKAKELRKLSGKDIDKKIEELKLEMIKLNAQVATGTQLKNPGQIRTIRRTIARINTIKQEEGPKHE
ncbi:50S ribosomal protein L29 [Candidatus Woesearchaeota archaeon]|nr:50S ribosomal protein L29 [Candidatus Woesearchaeota archaeon]